MSLSDLHLIGLRRNVTTILIVSSGGPLQITIHSGPLKLRLRGVRTYLRMPSVHPGRNQVVQHQRAAIDVLGIAPFLYLIAEYVLELNCVVDRPPGGVNYSVVIPLVDFIVGQGRRSDSRRLLLREDGQQLRRKSPPRVDR